MHHLQILDAVRITRGPYAGRFGYVRPSPNLPTGQLYVENTSTDLAVLVAESDLERVEHIEEDHTATPSS